MKKIVLVLAFLVGACMPISANEVRVAIDPTFPPLEYLSGDKYAGTSVEIIAELAKRVGFTYKHVPIRYPETLDGLVNDRIDMALAMSINSKRLEKVDFSESYYLANYLFLKPEDSPLDAKSDLTGKRIGVVHAGTSVHKFAMGFNGQVIAYEELSQLMLALKMDKIDCGILDSVAASVVLSDKFKDKMSNLYKEQFALLKDLGADKKLVIFRSAEKPDTKGMAISFQKNKNPEFVKKINEALESMKKDGTLFKILEQNGLY